jgi:hypothetical protein
MLDGLMTKKEFDDVYIPRIYDVISMMTTSDAFSNETVLLKFIGCTTAERSGTLSPAALRDFGRAPTQANSL